MIVTIDGPAGSGKSTVARLLADRLGFRFLDTGAMYRAVALAVLHASVSENDPEGVSQIARRSRLEFRGDRLFLNDRDVTAEIRSPEVTAISSIVASQPAVRERLVEMQRNIGREGGMVTEGRDQGTVVFPDAARKFFLTASLESRARRRHRELEQKGIHESLEEVTEQLRQRDERDEQRSFAPMKPADDAAIVDTSELSITDVVETLIQRIDPAMHGNARG